MFEKVTEILTEIDDQNSMTEDTCFSSDVINCWHNNQNFIDHCTSRRHLADSLYQVCLRTHFSVYYFFTINYCGKKFKAFVNMYFQSFEIIVS